MLAPACSRSETVADLTPIDTLPLQVRVVFDEAAALVRVSDIEWAGDGRLGLITSIGAVTVTDSGAERDRVVFSPPRPWMFPVRRLRDGVAAYYAGYDDSAGEIVFFDGTTGRELTRQPCKWCRDPVVVRLGDGVEALAVRANDGSSATLFLQRGSERREIASRGHLTDLGAVKSTGDQPDTLVFFTSPDPDLQKGIRLVRPDGTETAKWVVAARAAVAVVAPARGAPSVVTLDGDAVVEWDALTGHVNWRAPLEGASRFRELLLGPWSSERRVVVLSGGGSLDKHLVAVIDVNGTLLYRRIADDRAWAVSVAGDRQFAFYVGAAGRVERYSITP